MVYSRYLHLQFSLHPPRNMYTADTNMVVSLLISHTHTQSPLGLLQLFGVAGAVAWNCWANYSNCKHRCWCCHMHSGKFGPEQASERTEKWMRTHAGCVLLTVSVDHCVFLKNIFFCSSLCVLVFLSVHLCHLAEFLFCCKFLDSHSTKS